MVLPKRLREQVVTGAGEVLVRPTADGLLITPAGQASHVTLGADGMPVPAPGTTGLQ
ncbi:MAG: hypothetical protein AB1673_03055 [Actinomycetota bacterium]